LEKKDMNGRLIGFSTTIGEFFEAHKHLPLIWSTVAMILQHEWLSKTHY